MSNVTAVFVSGCGFCTLKVNIENSLYTFFLFFLKKKTKLQLPACALKPVPPTGHIRSVRFPLGRWLLRPYCHSL